MRTRWCEWNHFIHNTERHSTWESKLESRSLVNQFISVDRAWNKQIDQVLFICISLQGGGITVYGMVCRCLLKFYG